MKRLVILAIILLSAFHSFAMAQVSEFRPIRGYKTEMYDVLFNPYPIPIGKEVKIRVWTPYDPQSVTVVLDKETKYPLKKEGDYWRGIIRSPESYIDGWNLSFVYIKYKRSDIDKAALQKIMDLFTKIFASVKLTEYKEYIMIEGKVWIRAYKEGEPSLTATNEASTLEGGATQETGGLKIKGSKNINFVSRSIEGSKEGFVAGLTREEALRVNIAGKIDKETDVDATFISTSTSGTTATTLNEDKVSILVRRASTEVYYGDFIADFNETEFARMNKSLSGIKISGNYDKWGFMTLYSTPRGQSKYFKAYGNGTQGPYNLGNAPVVVDSDRVYINGAEQKRGNDYTIDYQAGTITFRKGVVINTSIIEAYYDWRESLYQHETIGLRYKQQVNDNLKMGVTYLNDSDNLYKASEIRDTLSSTIEPVSHFIVGVDGSGKLGNTLIDSELAYSNRDLNILEPGTSREIGKAIKISTSTDFAPFTLATRYKRVGPQFMSISDASPKQDVWQWGGDLGFKPNSEYYAGLNYGYDKYTLLGTKYLTSDQYFKSKWTPKEIPSLNYYYRKTEDSNDPVTTAQISRTTTKHSADSNYTYGFMNYSAGGGIEERVNTFPSNEVTTYKTANFGAATYGLEKISLSGNVELKETELPDLTKPFTKTYNANASITPNRNYFGSLSLQIIDDSIQGMTNVTDLNYRASPYDNFSTDGKYTIQAVKEDFNGTPEAVSKQTGSFKFDYRPIDVIRCKYYFKPAFTRVESTQTNSFSDYINQSEIQYSLFRELTTGLVYKTEDLMNIDRTDSEYRRELNHKNTYDTTFLVKSAPLRFLSLEFTYLTGDLLLTELTTPGATAHYDTVGNTKQYQIDAKTSLSEQFSIDSRYSLQDQLQKSDALLNNISTLTQTIYLKGSWNYNENWTYFASYAYSESINRLLTDEDITYTISPGLGATYRIMEIFRIDGEYIRSMSYAASSSQVDTYSLKAKYDPNENVHVNLRGTREIAVEPNYRSSEIMGSLEIVL
jgi:hypothetical protein